MGLFLTGQKKMAAFSFLEITYDPFISRQEDVYHRLESLGFVHRSQHAMDFVGFWSLGNCILMVREESIEATPRLSGIGFLGTVNDIDALDAEFDPSCDFFKVVNPNGLDTYIIQENQIKHSLELSYVVKDALTISNKQLKSISGIKIPFWSIEMIEHYEALGFKIVSDSDKYTTMLSQQNSFTLLCCKDKLETKTTLICDTDDIFNATAYFFANGFELREFDIGNELNFGNKLNFKINSYNCKAWGTQNSYTIENILENVTPDVDIIFRQRKNYLKILEDTVDSYYNEQTE